MIKSKHSPDSEPSIADRLLGYLLSIQPLRKSDPEQYQSKIDYLQASFQRAQEDQ